MKKIIPIVAILILGVGGILAYTNFTKDDSSLPSEQKQQEKQTGGDSQTLSGSVKELLGLGKDLKCTWSVSEEESSVEGTAWVSGDKTRVEMEIETGQGVQESIFVSDGEYVYLWGDNKGGIKYKVDQFEEQAGGSEGETGEASYQGLDQEYDYRCESWSADFSKFEVPSEVEFTDMSQLMQQTQQQMDNTQENLKSVCNSLPEPQKTECLQGLE